MATNKALQPTIRSVTVCAELSREHPMNQKSISLGSIIQLLGVLASAILFVLAAASYPGGYDWFGQSLSSLIQPSALNGSLNTAPPSCGCSGCSDSP